jgi:HD-like signal output (HDOD) protein
LTLAGGGRHSAHGAPSARALGKAPLAIQKLQSTEPVFLPSLPHDEWLSVTDELPMTPAIFARLSSLLSKPSTTLEDVVAAVELDPILTSRVVRVANSPLYRRDQPVISITEAIAYIGTQETSQIVGYMIAGNLYSKDLPHYKIEPAALWNSCVGSAVAARLLAERVGLESGECYTIALLRGIGWLALERFAEKNALPVSPLAFNDPETVNRWERQVFGMVAPEATLRVLQLWSFSPTVIAALRRLGRRPYTDPLTSLLAIANGIGERLGLGLAVERGHWTITQPLLKAIGLGPEQLPEIVQDTTVEMEKLRKILGQDTLQAPFGVVPGSNATS